MDRADDLSSTAMRAGRDGVAAVRRAVVVAIGAALVLTCWAAAIGRYGGPDEPAHVLRAYAVAHGDLRAEPAAGLPPGYRTVTVPASLGTGDPACYRHDPTTSSECAAGERGGEVAVATSAGTNPPLYYALVGLLPRLLGADDDPFAHRLAALGLVSVALGLVAARLRTTSSARVLVLAAVTPSCVFLWGVVNPNALEIVLVALATTGVVGGRSPVASSGADVGPDGAGPGGTGPDGADPDLAPVDCWWVSIPLALAIAMRPIAAVWALAVLFLAVLAMRRNGARVMARRRAALLAPPAFAVAAMVAWNAWTGLVVDDERTAGTGSAFEAVTSSIGGLPRSGAELVASMGWLEYWAPWPSLVGWGIAVAAGIGVAAAGRPVLRTSSWLVLGIALVVVPVAFEVAWYERIGLIWQGRYSLPVAAIALILVGGSATTPPPTRRRWVPIVAVVAAAVGMQLAFWNAARRYAVGIDGSWWFHAAVESGRWLGPGTWVVVHGALVAVAAAVAVRSVLGPMSAAGSGVSSSGSAGWNATDRAAPTADPQR